MLLPHARPARVPGQPRRPPAVPAGRADEGTCTTAGTEVRHPLPSKRGSLQRLGVLNELPTGQGLLLLQESRTDPPNVGQGHPLPNVGRGAPPRTWAGGHPLRNVGRGHPLRNVGQGTPPPSTADVSGEAFGPTRTFFHEESEELAPGTQLAPSGQAGAGSPDLCCISVASVPFPTGGGVW